MALVTVLFTCEKDDICPAEVDKTPSLVIEFRNISSQDSKKGVPTLKITGIGNDDELYEGDKNLVTINLPLKTDTDSTKFVLHSGYKVDDNKTPDDTSDDKILGNKDTITISYTRANQFISRACGFKTVFNNPKITTTEDTSNWLRLTEPVSENQTIENEKNAHFYFYH